MASCQPDAKSTPAKVTNKGRHVITKIRNKQLQNNGYKQIRNRQLYDNGYKLDESHIHNYSIPGTNTSHQITIEKLADTSTHNTINRKHKHPKTNAAKNKKIKKVLEKN